MGLSSTATLELRVDRGRECRCLDWAQKRPGRIALLRDNELVLAHALRPRVLFIPENGAHVLAWLAGLAEGDEATERGSEDEAALRSVFEAHGLLEENGAFEAELEALASRVREDRSHHTLHVCVHDAQGRCTEPRHVILALAARVHDLDERAELEVVFFGPRGEIDWPLARQIVEGALELSDAQEKRIRFSFRVSSASGAASDEALRWAAEREVVVVVEGRAENAGRIETLTHAGVRAPVRVDVACTAPKDLRTLVERLVNANAAVGLVLSRSRAPAYPADETADAVLDVQRHRPLPLRRMHPQNDWLDRIELAQGLPWSCGAATGHVTAFGPAGSTAACPLLLQEDGHASVRSAHGNAHSEEATIPKHSEHARPLQTAIAHGVDDTAECRDCQLRYICGGPCCAAAPGCLFERDCLEDLLFDTAKNVTTDERGCRTRIRTPGFKFVGVNRQSRT